MTLKKHDDLFNSLSRSELSELHGFAIGKAWDALNFVPNQSPEARAGVAEYAYHRAVRKYLRRLAKQKHRVAR